MHHCSLKMKVEISFKNIFYNMLSLSIFLKLKDFNSVQKRKSIF